MQTPPQKEKKVEVNVQLIGKNKANHLIVILEVQYISYLFRTISDKKSHKDQQRQHSN